MTTSLATRTVRARRALAALVGLARNPGELQRVFDLGEALNAGRAADIVQRFEADPEGRRLLARRPSINTASVDFAALEALPDGTLGREYVRFLTDNAIGPDVFKAPDIADERAAFIMQRIRQTHDLWHVLTGYTPDVVGEILLQAFTYAQTRAPSALAITALGAVKFGRRTPRFWRRLVSAYRQGRATRTLATFAWEDHWEDPVEKLRGELHCARVPSSAS